VKFLAIRALIGRRTSRIEDPGIRFRELRFPLSDVIGMEVETLGELRVV
jgi:hypothetical protein